MLAVGMGILGLISIITLHSPFGAHTLLFTHASSKLIPTTKEIKLKLTLPIANQNRELFPVVKCNTAALRRRNASRYYYI